MDSTETSPHGETGAWSYIDRASLGDFKSLWRNTPSNRRAQQASKQRSNNSNNHRILPHIITKRISLLILSSITIVLLLDTMLSSKNFRLAGLSLLSISTQVIPSVAQSNVGSSLLNSANALQEWYNVTSGLWNTAGWWNGANILTMLGDYAALDSSAKATVENIYLNTFVQAEKYDLAVYKDQQDDGTPVSFYSDSERGIAIPSGIAAGKTVAFTDDYYDDDGWWALAWIQAFDVTGNSTYLSTAEAIFVAMAEALNTNCSSGGGGIYWSKTSTYVNAIANELFLSVAAHLANRVSGDDKQTYLTHALDQWTWFQNSGMINEQNLINDGLTAQCTNNGQKTWSYNQGVILGALIELDKASPNGNYVTAAKNIASAAISTLAVNGILHESCEPNCGSDGTQFKGVFMRNLRILNTAYPESAYATFINDNANSIISKDTNSANQMSVAWAGPFVNSANASTQSSAMDALVAALSVQNGTASKKRSRSARLVY